MYAVLRFRSHLRQYPVLMFLHYHDHCWPLYDHKFKCNADYRKSAPKRDSPVQLKAIPTDWLEAPADAEAAAPLRSAKSACSIVCITSVKVL